MTVFANRGDTRDGHLFLFRTDVLRLGSLRRIGEEDEAEDRYWQSDDAVCNSQSCQSLARLWNRVGSTNQEHPLPSTQSTHAFHALVNSRHHDTGEHGTRLS